MSPSMQEGIVESVRTAFGDDEKSLFTDGDILFFLDEARREYCMLSSALVGRHEFHRSPDGVYQAPSDFIRPVEVLVDHESLPVMSYRRIMESVGDFRGLAGHPSCACFDFDTWGTFRIVCNPPVDFVGHLVYERLPSGDDNEIVDVDALRSYCLYVMNFIYNRDNYSLHHGRFLEAVGRRNGSNRRLDSRSSFHRGSYL